MPGRQNCTSSRIRTALSGHPLSMVYYHTRVFAQDLVAAATNSSIMTFATTVCFRNRVVPGLTLRTTKKGPEANLVKSFLTRCLPRPTNGCALTVFLEPAIETGYPDIVAAYWHMGTALRWPLARNELTTVDLKLAQLIYCHGGASTERIKFFFPSGAVKSLARLESARIVKHRGDRWEPRSIVSTIAIRRLIAIEAKTFDWKSGIDQAIQNTWFTSESYVLMNTVPKNQDAIHASGQFGIDFCTLDKPIAKGVVRARKRFIPKSYATWLFNEWVWRFHMSAGRRI